MASGADEAEALSRKKLRLVKRNQKMSHQQSVPGADTSTDSSTGRAYATVAKGEFPSLSNNSQLSSGGQASLWSSAGSRNMAPIQRNQPTPLSSQQGQQDDLFSSSRLASQQGSFRFGSQSSTGQSSQPQPGSIDDFPPLNNSNGGFRNGNGDIGQERGSSLMSTLGFGAQPSPAPSLSGNRAGNPGNGLLNALNNHAADARSPDAGAPGSSRPQDIRSAIGSDEPRQKPPGFRDDSAASPSSTQDPTTQSSEARNALGAIGNDLSLGKGRDETDSQAGLDPLAGMSPLDKWGIKGLRTLMNNYPDYSSAVTGVDPNQLGLNLQSSEPISTQIYSLFNDAPPRPAIPAFRLPECYSVTNVQPLENKIQSFNEETLMWIFYSCPGDVKQHLAAAELNNRNWRWHKRLQIWLTKDDQMAPRSLSPQHEQGYYIIWDTNNWTKVREPYHSRSASQFRGQDGSKGEPQSSEAEPWPKSQERPGGQRDSENMDKCKGNA
ncbi:hypothetical protein JX266_004462 [Neoarthrinium moseri]|nr:hypothetical protein JX266_004462 [Neoarthrinium moseri]